MTEAIVELANDSQKSLQSGENGYRYVNMELSWKRKYHKIYIDNYNNQK